MVLSFLFSVEIQRGKPKAIYSECYSFLMSFVQCNIGKLMPFSENIFCRMSS